MVGCKLGGEVVARGSSDLSGFFLAAIVGGLAWSCGDHPIVAPAPPNIVLVSVDTLRADHLGVYGYPRPTSPAVDSFAETALVYLEATAPTPWTLPSHASMLTGTHPYSIGMRSNLSAIPPGVPRLAERLAAAGYATAAFVDSSPKGYVGAQRGFAQGFASFAHAPFGQDRPRKHDMAATVAAAEVWLDGRETARPFFLFLHTKSVHAAARGTPCVDGRCLPYDPPAPHRARFLSGQTMLSTWSSPEMGHGQDYLWSLNRALLAGAMTPADLPSSRLEELVALYDGGIAHFDEQFARLLASIERHGLGGSTVVVLTADHGEAFLEHNLLLHQEVYRQLLHIPLIVRLPARDGGVTSVPLRLPQRVTLADIAPTLLELAGVQAPPEWSGTALPRDLTAPSTAAAEFAYYLFPTKFSYRAFSLREGAWKLVRHNFGDPETFRTELYDIESDPGEQTPKSGEAERTAAMLRELDRRLRQRPVLPPLEVDDDGEAAGNLASLGYLN